MRNIVISSLVKHPCTRNLSSLVAGYRNAAYSGLILLVFPHACSFTSTADMTKTHDFMKSSLPTLQASKIFIY
jgi:hypothetical protein